jgi:putative Holliday junction resolvase
MRLLALDVGDSRIGIAISDPNGQVAVPFKTIQRRFLESDIAEIAGLAAEEEVEALVVGLPLSLDGTAGRQAERVQEFASHLQAAVSLPIEFWDERLSTAQAERLLSGRQEGQRRARPRPRKGKAEQDALAAAIILQGYLDSRRGGSPDPQRG